MRAKISAMLSSATGTAAAEFTLDNVFFDSSGVNKEAARKEAKKAARG